MKLPRITVPLLLAAVIAGCSAAQPSPSDGSASASSSTAADATGTIEGRVSYPAGFRPTLDVFAIDVDDENHWFTVQVLGTEEAGHDPQGAYTLEVEPGTYYVIAYPPPDTINLAGLYSTAVPCGLTVACTDHSLLAVTVLPGETATGIDPGDWYYPEGHEYPDRPG